MFKLFPTPLRDLVLLERSLLAQGASCSYSRGGARTGLGLWPLLRAPGIGQIMDSAPTFLL